MVRDVVYGTYRNSKGFNQLEWIRAQRVYHMPVERAEEIGIVDEAAAMAKKVLFLVSGAQGRKDKPSVFRIVAGSARLMGRGEFVAEYGYPAGKGTEGGMEGAVEREYWVWRLEGGGGEG